MKKGLVILLIALALMPSNMFASGSKESGPSNELTAYIGSQEDEAMLICDSFEKATGIKVQR